MPTTRLFLTALALTEACFTPDPATDGVFVDGRFDEWSAAATILDDSADEPESAIDVRSILGLDDAGWLYLSLDLGREVNVQSLPGTLHLLIDADADSVRTGGTLHGMDLSTSFWNSPKPTIRSWWGEDRDSHSGRLARTERRGRWFDTRSGSRWRRHGARVESSSECPDVELLDSRHWGPDCL